MPGNFLPMFVLTFAGKTSNYYKACAEPNGYTTLVNKNVTKSYKKADNNVPKVISFDHEQIAESLELCCLTRGYPVFRMEVF